MPAGAGIGLHLSLALFVCLLSISGGALAEEDIDAVLDGFADEVPTEEDDPLAGFGDDIAVVDSPTRTAIEPSPPRDWDLRGDVSLTVAYNYDYPRSEEGEPDHRGLSQLRLQFRPELLWAISDDWDAKISASLFYDAAYKLNGRSQYPDRFLRHQESEGEFRDTYLRGRLSSSLDTKLGRQIIVWGKSENLRVVDVLNPLDLREPGQTDIEDMRLPVSMARLDYFWSNWSLTGVAIPEIRFNKNPVYGSAYYPGADPAPPEKVPDDWGGNTEYAAALQAVMSGWDLSFHLARVWDDEAHLGVDSGQLAQQHSRLTMAGVAANAALGNWLLKGESAHLDGKVYSAAPEEQYRRTDLLLGLEYSGFDNVSLSMETAVRHIHGYDDFLGAGPAGLERNTWQTALRYSGDYWRDRLNLLVLAVRWGESLDEGGYSRLEAGYELAQALELSGGVVLYHSGETEPFATFADNDRIFVRLQYDY